MLPELRTGVYQHWKGHHYLVLGYAHDANQAGRNVVVYVGLELDGASDGPRLAVRDVEDFFARVETENGWTMPRFEYVGPDWTA
jgi:hypothetical protein